MKPSKSMRTLGVFTLTMMGISAILSLRNLPIAAMYGVSIITYYIAAAILFLIPTALVCTELSTMWPDSGGLYVWVNKALGKQFGLLAIWFEWINTIFSFPSMMGFILFSLIYPFAQHLANSRLIEFSFMVGIFWCVTLVNFFNIKVSGWFSASGAIFGVLLISLLFIIMGVAWLVNGHPSQIDFHWSALIPTFKLGSLAFLIAVINSLSGIQVIAFHASETKDPSRTMPKVALMIVCIILFFSISGALAIAVVTPHSESSNLVGGVVQALITFFNAFHLLGIVKVIVVLMAIGIIAGINSWVIGPSKGMLAAAEAGQLPKVLAHRNKHGMPTTLLLLQAIVTTLLSAAYIYMPSVNSAYWLLSNLTGQFTVMMWILVFVSAIILQYKHSDTARPYRIPGGHAGMWVVGMLGIIVCITVLAFSYIPPSKVIGSNGILKYESTLIIGLILFSVIPIVGTLLQAKRKNEK